MWSQTWSVHAAGFRLLRVLGDCGRGVKTGSLEILTVSCRNYRQQNKSNPPSLPVKGRATHGFLSIKCVVHEAFICISFIFSLNWIKLVLYLDGYCL